MDNTITDKAIDNLLKFLPVFKKESFASLKQEELQKNTPYMFCYSKDVESFIKACYENDFLLKFDWVKWQDQAVKYLDDPTFSKSADLETIRKLITLHLRKERFCEGHLIDMIDRGHITILLERLSELRK